MRRCTCSEMSFVCLESSSYVRAFLNKMTQYFNKLPHFGSPDVYPVAGIQQHQIRNSKNRRVPMPTRRAVAFLSSVFNYSAVQAQTESPTPEKDGNNFITVPPNKYLPLSKIVCMCILKSASCDQYRWAAMYQLV